MDRRNVRCEHPPDQRWQYRDMWMCCRCCRYFWGLKERTPETDIYGIPTSGAPVPKSVQQTP